MQINLGSNANDARNGRDVPVTWDSRRTISSHGLVLGDTGTGKSTMLRKIISQACATSAGRLRVHVIDPHGDMGIDGASSVKFFGINGLWI
ncbi:helicase HerA domain-containing protein [Undibacterium arcticum]